MEAIHAVNAVLWQPGEQTQNCREKNEQRQTDYYTRGRPRASGHKTKSAKAEIAPTKLSDKNFA